MVQRVWILKLNLGLKCVLPTPWCLQALYPWVEDLPCVGCGLKGLVYMSILWLRSSSSVLGHFGGVMSKSLCWGPVCDCDHFKYILGPRVLDTLNFTMGAGASNVFAVFSELIFFGFERLLRGRGAERGGGGGHVAGQGLRTTSTRFRRQLTPEEMRGPRTTLDCCRVNE